MKFLFLIFSVFTFSVLHASVYDNISAMLEATSCTFRVQMLSDGSGYGVYADMKGGTVYGSPFSQSTYVDAGFYKINNGKAGYFLIKTGSSASSYIGVAIPGQTYVVGVYSIDGYDYKWPSTDGAPYKSWDVTIAADGKSLASADAAKQAAAAAKKAADDANAAATAAATASSTAKTSASSANTASANTANTASGAAGTSAGSAATSAGSTAGSMSSNSSDFAGLVASMGQVGQILVRSMEAANANSQGERALLKGAMDTMGTTATQQGAQMQAGIDSMRAGIAAQGATGLAQIQAANETTAAVKALGSGSGSGTDVAGVENRLDTTNDELRKNRPADGAEAQAGVDGAAKAQAARTGAASTGTAVASADGGVGGVGYVGASGTAAAMPTISEDATPWRLELLGVAYDFNPLNAARANFGTHFAWGRGAMSAILSFFAARQVFRWLKEGHKLLQTQSEATGQNAIMATPFGVGVSSTSASALIKVAIYSASIASLGVIVWSLAASAGFAPKFTSLLPPGGPSEAIGFLNLIFPLDLIFFLPPALFALQLAVWGAVMVASVINKATSTI